MGRLRVKACGFIARARLARDPAERARLLAAARATLAQARREEAAQYVAAVGRAGVSVAGYRAWQAARLRSA